MKILLTGAAGFIGYHATKKLCSNKSPKYIDIEKKCLFEAGNSV